MKVRCSKCGKMVKHTTVNSFPRVGGGTDHTCKNKRKCKK